MRIRPSQAARDGCAALRSLSHRQTNAGARRASLLFVTTGLIVPIVARFATPAGPDTFRVLGVGAIAVLVGIVVWTLPWNRWHPRLILITVPCAFALGVAAKMVQFTPLEYGVYYVIVFVWVGLTQRRWTSVAFSPLAFGMYILALRLAPTPLRMAAIMTSAWTVVPVSILVGEIVAAQVADLTRSRRESEHRAELLRAVSTACRSISTLDRAAVLAAVADSLGAIGFAASSFTFFTTDGMRYRVEEARGLPFDYQRDTHGVAGTLTGLVRERGATVVLDDYAAADVAHPALASAQFRSTIATPVWVSGDLVGALIAGSHCRIALTRQDVEAVEILAAQAGRALENARTFQAEVAVRQQLVADSMRDVLTGIGNRRHAMRILESLRTGDALALIDLDHFKAVNDTYGHAAGDTVLTELGAFLTGALRDGDDVARFGGEEFLLVLRNAGAEAGAILGRLTEDWRLLAVRTTFSTGYSMHERGADPAETLGNADSALYAAKAAGRDRVRVFLANLPAQRANSGQLLAIDGEVQA